MTNQIIPTSQRPFYKPGWYPDLSNDAYHGSFGYGSTTLKILSEKTKAHMDYHLKQPNEYTDATLTGQVVHTLAMEPEKFDLEFAVRPLDLKRPSITQFKAKNPSDTTLKQIEAWQNWQRKLDKRTEVTAEIHEKALKMATKLRQHPQVGKFLKEGVAEQSIYYWYNPESWDDNNDYRIMCRVRPDWIIPGHSCLFDIKTTRDASFSGFMRQAKKLSYHMSAAMYLDGVNRCREFLAFAKVIAFTQFVWICVENEPPYEVASYELTEKDREEGQQLYHALVRKLDQYNRSDWQGYGDWDGTRISPAARLTDLPPYGNPIV